MHANKRRTQVGRCWRPWMFASASQRTRNDPGREVCESQRARILSIVGSRRAYRDKARTRRIWGPVRGVGELVRRVCWPTCQDVRWLGHSCYCHRRCRILPTGVVGEPTAERVESQKPASPETFADPVFPAKLGTVEFRSLNLSSPCRPREWNGGLEIDSQDARQDEVRWMGCHINHEGGGQARIASPVLNPSTRRQAC